MHTIKILALLLAAAPATAATAKSSDRLQVHIQQMEISGVYWGEKEADVRADLAAHSYAIDDSRKSTAKEFPDQVAAFVDLLRQGFDDETRSNSTYDLIGTKGPESLDVRLVGYPDGWRVASAVYTYKGGIAPKELAAQASAKFKAAGFTEWNWSYCIPEAESCTDMPYIQIDPWFGEFKLTLLPGKLGEDTADAPWREAVAKAKGTAKPSF